MRNKAFTLTEAIVVIVILGVMASLAIPRYGITMESFRSRTSRDGLT